ncbi:MAG TPA: peptidase E, partial [Gemmatimonadaceae bacterium]|nr:peptidase E [Gemmatimonadaceae bacterium]
MKRRDFLVSSALAVGAAAVARSPLGGLQAAATNLSRKHAATRKILIAGGNYGEAFVRYMGMLTGKPRPRLCYLPTASADRADGIISWYRTCAPLNVEPFVQESFISSYRQMKGFDEVLLSMDGIVASGGNTLNQQA